jgi:hypothetical protein
MSENDTLPDDPILLKKLLAQREAMIEQIKLEVAQRIEAMERKHQAEIEAMLNRFYGPRSERFAAVLPENSICAGNSQYWDDG